MLVITKTRNKDNGKNVGGKRKIKRENKIFPEGLRSEQESMKQLQTVLCGNQCNG
jgi:hypothetical protein